jgi:hypothetical protein
MFYKYENQTFYWAWIIIIIIIIIIISLGCILYNVECIVLQQNLNGCIHALYAGIQELW